MPDHHETIMSGWIPVLPGEAMDLALDLALDHALEIVVGDGLGDSMRRRAARATGLITECHPP